MATIPANLQQTQIKKGSALNLFDKAGNTIGFATNHTFQTSVNLQEINCKDAGDSPLQIPGSITWNIQCEYLYATDNMDVLLAAAKAKQPLAIKFCEVANYATTDEIGIVDGNQGAGGTGAWTMGKVIAEGKVIISDFTINSAAGENASISCTMTGTGSYATGAQGAGEWGVQSGAQSGNQGATGVGGN